MATETIVARFKSVAPTEQRAQDGSVIWDAVIDHPTVKKAGTKFADIARAASDLMFANKVAKITLGVVEREVNGTMRRNYYLNKVEEAPPDAVPASTDSAIGSSGSSTREYGWKTDPEDAWRIALSVGSERAVSTLPMMPQHERDFETQKRIALAWADFIFGTPRPTVVNPPLGRELSSSERSTSAPGAYDEPTGAASGASYEQAPPDDDIPFEPTLGPWGL